MPKRISKAKKKRSKRPLDFNQLAHQLVKESTETDDTAETVISQIMREMGRKGGKIGGKRSLDTMTPEERTSRAHGAALARWKKRGKVK